MSNYRTHALSEFRAKGWMKEDGTFKDEMQEQMCNGVLKMLDIFADEGHSGLSAAYAIDLFKKIARFEPLSPLTGEDDEWNDVDDGVYQNKRIGSVFKQSDRYGGKPYWLDGKVFWEWCSAPDIDDGKPFKSYYTSVNSHLVIEFPWVKPESQYVFVPTDEFPTEEL